MGRPFDLSSAAALPNAYFAVVGDFALGYAGSGASEGLVLMSGLLADELYNAETFPTRIEVDMRRTNPINTTMLPIFRNLQRARATAELVSGRFAALDSLNVNRVEIQALDAYTYVLLAENYCNGVPTSRIEGADFVYGAPQSNAQMLTVAIAKSDSAIVVAGKIGAGANNALNLARVGRRAPWSIRETTRRQQSSPLWCLRHTCIRVSIARTPPARTTAFTRRGMRPSVSASRTTRERMGFPSTRTAIPVSRHSGMAAASPLPYRSSRQPNIRERRR